MQEHARVVVRVSSGERDIEVLLDKKRFLCDAAFFVEQQQNMGIRNSCPSSVTIGKEMVFQRK